jgi:uncharacterized protein YfdQ (DUF2303 family)
MDASAIEVIQETAIEAAQANRLNTHVPAVIIGGKVISLENFQGKRAYFRGAFATSVLAEFADYVKTHGGTCFIAPKGCRAKAIHNLGGTDNPGPADWTSSLELEARSAYGAVLDIEGEPLTQKELVAWLEDWSHDLATCTSAEQASDNTYANYDPLANGLHAIRTLNIKATKDTTHTDKDFGASRSSMEDIEASSKGQLPYGFVMRTAPYEGFGERDFTLRLSVLTGDDPRLKLRLVSAQALHEDIAQEFRQLLQGAIGGAATLHIGSFTP